MTSETKEKDIARTRKIVFTDEYSTKRNTVVRFAPSHTIILLDEDREPTCWAEQEDEQDNEQDNKQNVQQDDEQDEEKINRIKETIDINPSVELHKSSPELVAPQKIFCQCQNQKHLSAAVFEGREKSLGNVTEINK